MTSRERRVWTIVCSVVIPAAVLLIDAAFYVSMRAWTYNLKDHGAAAFWPIVLTWGAVFFPLAAGIFGQAIFDLWSARRSTRWRVTQGRVTDSSIEISEYAQRSLIGLDTVQEYLPKVAYAYEAEGDTYNNDLTAFGLAPFESREEAERMLRPYPRVHRCACVTTRTTRGPPSCKPRARGRSKPWAWRWFRRSRHSRLPSRW